MSQTEEIEKLKFQLEIEKKVTDKMVRRVTEMESEIRINTQVMVRGERMYPDWVVKLLEENSK